MEEKYFSKCIFNYILMIIVLLTSEIIFRLLSNLSIFTWGFFRIFLGLNIISIIFSLLISLSNQKTSRIVALTVAFLFSLYTFLQIGFNNYLGVYISFRFSQFGIVVYILDFFSSLKISYYLIFLPIILLIGFLIIFKNKIKYPSLKTKNVFNVLFISIALITLSLIYIYTINAKFMQDDLQQISNAELTKDPVVSSIAIKEFGTIGYGILDLKSLFFPTTSDTINITFEKRENLNHSRIIDDTIWNKIVASEENTLYNTLNKYFINREITEKNDYTGLFEDKNLIIIMMESVDDIFINKEYYPNFYKLYTEGWHFSNNYSPRNSCAIGNNEMSGMISLFPLNDSCSLNEYKTNTYSESIFNLFNNKGYQTSSMYSYTDEHYQRGTIHKNMGSQKYYGVHALEIPYTNDYGEWTSDEEFFSKLLEIIDEYDEDTKFMTWLTTVSTNQPYSTSSKYGDLYLDLFKNTNYSDATKRYLSKLKVLDNAIGILIDGLKTRNILDDTVIILYSDNYPYGLAKTDIEKILGNIYADGLVDKTPFVIYNPSLEAKEYNQYTTYMNLTPTVANLFNLDYDPRLYLGEDILSDDYQGIVVFADGSWKNEHVYFDAATSNIKYYDDFYNIDDIKKISTDVFMRMKVSALAIKNNYFNYLNKTFIRNKEEDSDTGIKIEVDTESSNQTNESVETNLEKVEQNE